MKKINKALAIAAIAAASLFSVQTASAAKLSDPETQMCWEVLQGVDISSCPEWQAVEWRIAFKIMVEKIRDQHIKITKQMADYLLEWGWVAGYNRDTVMSYIWLDIEG